MGGPDRPIPQNEPASKLERPGLGSPTSSSVSNALAATSGVGSDLYNRLGAAISERGQMLDGLEDTVGSLQQGSSNMLAQVGFPLTFNVTGVDSEPCCRRKSWL